MRTARTGPNRRRLLATVAALALAIAGIGCGEKDEPEVTAPTTSAPTVPTTTAPAVPTTPTTPTAPAP